MFRTQYTTLTPEYIRDKLAAAQAPSQGAPAMKLNGQKFSIVTDNGPKLTYAFEGES